MAIPRGSVFGALLLIAIGGLFLWANLDPTVRPWSLIGRYWPLLIVFWGLSKLIDYLSLRGTPEAAQAARFGAGDIIGLILLLMLGTAVSRVTQASFWDRAGVDSEDWRDFFENRYQFTRQLERPLKTPGTLNISNDGDVTLATHDADRLQATIRYTVYAANQEEAERRAQNYEVTLLEPTGSGPGASYDLRWKRMGREFGPARADIDLRVPPRLDLKLETRRGDARVKGLAGDLSIELSRGDAEISGTSGAARVHVSQRGNVRASDVGSVEVRGKGREVDLRNLRGEASIEGEFIGPIRAANIRGETRFVSRITNFFAERVEGELELHGGNLSLRRVTGNLTVVTEDKDIRIEEVSGQVRIEDRGHGAIRLRFAQSPREPIEISTRSGDIELILPANSGFTLEARAPEGQISSDFSGPELKLKEEKGEATLTGNYGSRRVGIRLTTRYGSIRLLRATAAPTTRS